MTEPPSQRATTAENLLVPVATLVSVFGLAFASLLYTRFSGHLASVWPANAVILGVLMTPDARRWGALLMVGLAGLAGALLATGAAVWSILLRALCSGLEAFTCAVVLRKVLGRQVDLARGGDLVIFILMAGLVAPLLWGAPAAFILSIARHGPESRYLFEWCASTALGLLILTPTLVSLTPEALVRLFSRRRLGLATALSGLLADEAPPG